MAYQKNEAWKKVRECHLKVYPECRACGSLEDIQVHHVRYRGPRGKSEKPGDLMTLCEPHHIELHSLSRNTVPTLEAQVAFIERVQRQVMEEAFGHYPTIG